MSDLLTVAHTAEIPADCGISVRLQGCEFAVFNLDGQFYVLDGSCPHRGGPLGAGTIEDGSVYCPLHGWKFDIRTGAGIDHPEKSAKSWPVRVESGKIQICQAAETGGGPSPAMND